VDFIVGNPPWVNWENLPEVYRRSTHALWIDYGLFRQKGYKAKLGGAKDDISILMTYVCHDAYLKQSGRLGFVITQSVFKTKGGGEGFRGLRYSHPGSDEVCMSPIEVEDLSDLQPFEGATNRTALFTVGKSSVPVQFPVQYVQWKKKKGVQIDQDNSLSRVLAKVERRDLLAQPVEKNDLRSPWITGSAAALKALNKLSGQATYGSRKGVYCATNAIYWLTDVHKGAGGNVVISNLANSGKKVVKKLSAAVETEFVHKLVRGKDVGRWNWTAGLSVILPQDPAQPSKAVSEAALKVKYPKTFAYFKKFEGDIRACALLGQFFNPASDPFYSSYNVGTYTYAQFKVVWKEICPEIEAAVIEDLDRDVIPDHKLVLVAFGSAEPAYFLCGLLNSAPIGLFVRSYAVQTSISGHIFDYVALPEYASKNPLHQKVARLAKECHSAAGSKLASKETELDEAVASLLAISAGDMKTIHDELRTLRASARRLPAGKAASDEDSDE